MTRLLEVVKSPFLALLVFIEQSLPEEEEEKPTVKSFLLKMIVVLVVFPGFLLRFVKERVGKLFSRIFKIKRRKSDE